MLKRNDFRAKVTAGINTLKVAYLFPIKTLVSEVAATSLAPIDVPPVSRVDKRKGKSSDAATSSAAKKRWTQVSSSSQGVGEDSSTSQSEELALESVANLSSPTEECMSAFPSESSAFRYPLEGLIPIETLYKKRDVDVISVQLHSDLVGNFWEHMRMVTVFL